MIAVDFGLELLMLKHVGRPLPLAFCLPRMAKKLGRL